MSEQVDSEEERWVAAAIHEAWRALGLKRGWRTPGSEKDSSFEELAPHLQQSNLAAARRMNENLRLVGARLVPGRAGPEEEAAARACLRLHLERLAEHEHEGWMAFHLEHGWRYAPERDDERRLHPCLVPYADLNELEKEKDRDPILLYPEFAARAERKIVFDSGVPGER